MSKYDIQANVLADIEIIGGDTTPWVIRFMQPGGGNYATTDSSSLACALYFKEYAMAGTPVLTKTGVVAQGADGEISVKMDFDINDTLALSGKYTYQIEISNGDNVRVGQGSLYIRKNLITTRSD